MRLKVLDVRDVAETQLCCGCGACAGIRPDDLKMVDTYEFGRRPMLKRGDASLVAAKEAMGVCPGVGLSHARGADEPGQLAELRSGWGPVLELWEGFASDPEIRYAGSSGGAASALALFCIEREKMHGLLHITARKDVPYLNRTVLSTTRAEIVGATGSRYSPASPCEGLPWVKDAPAPCVMIGKPCDIAAASLARSRDPQLHAQLGLTIAIFCAGTPTTKGTLEMMRSMGFADPAGVTGVRYRGNGWPGRATVTGQQGGTQATRDLSYDDSWGKILQKHRQWRCYVCADHTGEFADISVGDPWRHPLPENDHGRSLIVIRTERGRRILQAAIEAGYLTVTRSTPSALEETQPSLLAGRGATWGRITALRMLGLPAPKFRGLPMFRFWVTKLGVHARLRSIYGTFKRAHTKGLFRRHPVEIFNPVEAMSGAGKPEASAPPPPAAQPGQLGAMR